MAYACKHHIFKLHPISASCSPSRLQFVHKLLNYESYCPPESSSLPDTFTPSTSRSLSLPPTSLRHQTPSLIVFRFLTSVGHGMLNEKGVNVPVTLSVHSPHLPFFRSFSAVIVEIAQLANWNWDVQCFGKMGVSVGHFVADLLKSV